MKTMRTASIKPCPHCGNRIARGEQYIEVAVSKVVKKRTQLHQIEVTQLVHSGCYAEYTSARQ